MDQPHPESGVSAGAVASPLPRRSVIAALVIPACALVAAGIWLQRSETRRLRRHAELDLETVATLKVQQIVSWRTELLGDATLLTERPSLRNEVARFLASPRPASRAPLLARFQSVRRVEGYDDLLLVDPRGRIRLSLSGATEEVHGAVKGVLHQAFRTRRSVLTDLHHGPDGLPAHLEAVAPVFAGPEETAEPLGAVLLRCYADTSLLPLISTWPAPSRTAETLLVRREGEEVVFLNELRHRKGTALRLQFPLSQLDLPAAQVVRGHRGVTRGKDYRGVDVLAVVNPVPDSPWFIVAKVDADEALAPARDHALLIEGLLAVFVAATVVGLLALWQRASKGHYKALYEAERARVESETRYRHLFQNMTSGFAHCRMVFENGQPKDFVYLDVNPAFERQTGLSGVVGRPVSEVIPGIRESNPELFEIFGRVASTAVPEAFESYVAPLRIWFHVSVFSHEPGRFVAVFDNITGRKRVEAELRASEQRLRRFYESGLLGVIYWTINGQITDCNDAFLQMLGYTREELRTGGIDWIHLTPSEFRKRDEESVAELMATGVNRKPFEKEYIRKDGTRVPILIAGAMLDERRTEGVAFVLDISEQRQAQAERDEMAQQRRLALAAARLGWWQYDPVTRVSSYDKRYTEVFGVSGSESPNDEILKLLHPDDLPHVWAAVEAALDPADPRPYAATYRITRPDGVMIWVEAHGLATFEGDGDARHAVSLVGTVEDVTERKVAEEERLRLNEELERRVRERTAQLSAANEELGAFAYSVSHDLRAPLRGIDGWSLALLEDYADRLDDQGRQYLGRVRSEAQRMGRLIDDLLALSRVTRAEMRSEPVDLSLLAEAIVERLQAAHPGRQAQVLVQPNLSARGDPTLLEQALSNLLDNAWKFSSGRSPARIVFGRDPLDGARAFYVRDNGAGFDMDYSDKLFGAFQRLHRSSEFPGTGVGLATVQRIVHRHGGRIWAEAKVGEGATFYFTLGEDA